MSLTPASHLGFVILALLACASPHPFEVQEPERLAAGTRDAFARDFGRCRRERDPLGLNTPGRRAALAACLEEHGWRRADENRPLAKGTTWLPPSDE